MHAVQTMTGHFAAVCVSLVLCCPLIAETKNDALFESKVRPLLLEYCVKCHGSEKQKGGLRLDSRAEMLKGGESGPAVVVGKPDESLLIKAIRFEDLEMPPSGRLADEQIAILVQWVKDGAAWPNNTAPAATNTGHTARKPGTITAEDRAWWAFQVPKQQPIPAVGTGWARNPIDHFIAQKHEEAGLTPAPEAMKTALLRRVTFDLIGLPPTPEEIAAFLRDGSEKAFDRVVDRLLADPRYGERQARMWLDLVRYAESDGYRIDHPRPHAWRYRDYVIQSFNSDKPYDRFVQEQIAGDELYPNDPAALIATGYMRHGPYEYNQRDVRGQWSAIINDITDVTGDVFLGLGFGCARCHDHKFDPILQKDYFALQSFFAGIRFCDEQIFPSENERKRYLKELAEWETKTAEIRKRMDELLDPIRKKAMKVAAGRFPEDIQAIFAKAESERTTGEKQLYDLAYRQVDFEYGRADSKLSKGVKEEYEALAKELAAMPRPQEPIGMIVREYGSRAAETVIPGGRKKSISVEPAFPTVLGGDVPRITPSSDSTRRRSALAQWLTKPDHPLTYRVIVNRIWQQHFGVGLTATSSDYGTLGERPTHPELLDWLTVNFVESGKQLKHLHRLIVTSATYRQSAFNPSLSVKQKDTDNRLLTRMPIRRLEAEQVRDALFAVSGELKTDAGGPSVAATQPKRSIYTRVHRNDIDPLLASFDVADGLSSCAKRNITVTPTQSLLLLNSDFMLARAKAFAERVMPAEGKDALKGIHAAYVLAFAREPSRAEAEEALMFLKQQIGLFTDKRVTVTPPLRLNAWGDFCHTLMNSNEFLFVD